MALVISMGLMTGYREDLERKILGGSSEVIVSSRTPELDQQDELLERLSALEPVDRVAPALFTQGLASTRTNINGRQVTIKGVPHPSLPGPMTEKILGPRDRPLEGVVLGHHLAERLGAAVGDTLRLTVPVRESSTVLPRGRDYPIVRIYETGFFEIDDSWIFADLDALRNLVGGAGGLQVLEIDLHDDAELTPSVNLISDTLGPAYTVTDLRNANRALFRQLDFLQFILFIVIGMIVFVSTFNIVSMLIMTIEEKGREVALLLTLGASRRFVRRAFVWFGTLVGLAGTLLGLGLGVLTSWVLTRWELVSFGPEIAEVYLVTHIPFVNRPSHLLIITLFTLLVAWLASWLTAIRASRIVPASALRHG